ncbi:hypothetical protein BB560_006172 [Smittium megazygosporum]|uniref:Uncharacterized protein n=1 Tax=Smittium megazygosporum TaxID=133381 RepID=A0A2T9YEV8_9FUNG|nr:hypothetical protein BB560_006172 [Smittium megazygosporum]
MISGRSKDFGRSTTSTTSNNSDSGSKKWKIAFLGDQKLESHSIENQRLVLKDQGFSDLAINIIVSNKQSQKQKPHYFGVQRSFSDLRTFKNISNTVSGPEIVNFPLELYTLYKLKPSTLKAYKVSHFAIV